MKLRRIIGVLLCLALCLGMLSGCGGEKRYSGEFYGAFDTVVTVTAYCASQEEFDGLFSQTEEELPAEPKSRSGAGGGGAGSDGAAAVCPGVL